MYKWATQNICSMLCSESQTLPNLRWYLASVRQPLKWSLTFELCTRGSTHLLNKHNLDKKRCVTTLKGASRFHLETDSTGKPIQPHLHHRFLITNLNVESELCFACEASRNILYAILFSSRLLWYVPYTLAVGILIWLLHIETLKTRELGNHSSQIRALDDFPLVTACLLICHTRF